MGAGLPVHVGRSFSSAGRREATPDFDELPSGLSLRVEDSRVAASGAVEFRPNGRPPFGSDFGELRVWEFLRKTPRKSAIPREYRGSKIKNSHAFSRVEPQGRSQPSDDTPRWGFGDRGAC
jgi:hypothetical protein